MNWLAYMELPYPSKNTAGTIPGIHDKESGLGGNKKWESEID